MTHENFVTYEQAVKLKELGFEWMTIRHYDVETNKINPKLSRLFTICYDNWNQYNNTISAPTLAQAQKWLREIKKMIVNADIGFRANGKYFYFIVDSDGMPIVEGSSQLLFDTYEAALSAGIDKVFELLKSL